jgi:TIR domain
LRKDIQDIAARTAELVAATHASESVLTQAAPEDASAYDVFISHASEDKDRFVRPLAEALVRRGLSVWYDEFSLTVGDSLTASIDDGLSHSRYGIVVLSDHFFAKRWTKRELGGLVSRETAESKKLILPIWLGITRDQVVAASPTLADIVGIDGAKPIDETCDLLLKRIKPAPIVRAAAEDARQTDQDAAERDLEQRYRRAWRRHLFAETAGTDEFASLGFELVEGRYDQVNPSLRRIVLLRAARSAAAKGKSDDAKAFLAAAEGLKGEEPSFLAQARIADADGKTDEAIQLLRDREEHEARSVLLSILDRRKGTDAALEWWNGLGLSPHALPPAGVYVFAVLHIKKERFEKLKSILDGL